MKIITKTKKKMEKKNNTIIVVPDVHGRTAWKNVIPYANKEGYEIIFLGDYHDPYPHEHISSNDSLKNFKEIIEFRRANDNVTTLIGNHDLGYRFREICQCRHDYFNGGEVRSLFEENRDIFDIAVERELDNKKYLFSHAFVRKIWLALSALDYLKKEEVESAGIVNVLNDLYHKEDGDFIKSLADVSMFRGGYSSFGSIVWADVRETLDNDDDVDWGDDIDVKKFNSLNDYYQVFGHTMMEKPYISAKCACLDVPGKIFKIENGEITEL